MPDNPDYAIEMLLALRYVHLRQPGGRKLQMEKGHLACGGKNYCRAHAHLLQTRKEVEEVNFLDLGGNEHILLSQSAWRLH